MSSSTAPSFYDAMQAWRWWLGYLQAVTQGGPDFSPTFDQPILPGWTVAGLVVNDSNSGDPSAEQAIVSKKSYGRQLGRTMDALAALITSLKDIDAGESPFKEFFELKTEIDSIKVEAENARLERMFDDLMRLKTTDQAKFEELVSRVMSSGKQHET